MSIETFIVEDEHTEIDIMDALVSFVTNLGAADGIQIKSAVKRPAEDQDADISAAAGSTNSFTVNGSGTQASITPTNGPFKGVTLLFNGTGFTTDSGGNLTGGSISDLKFKTGGKILWKLELQNVVSTGSLGDAINAGSGKVNAKNFSELYDLIIPSFVTINGNNGKNVFSGNDGDDLFYGKGGNDLFMLFAGDDLMEGGKGKDTVDGSVLGQSITANLGKGFVKHGVHETTLKSVENVAGTKKGDTITGNNAKNQLDGSRGKDNIKGQGGNDLIEGGKGNDTLNGGKGKDKFLFHKQDGTDKIVDFKDGQDKLMLKGFGFKSKKAALKHFYEIGGANDDKVGFDYKGTKIIIKGADLKDIDVGDILI